MNEDGQLIESSEKGKNERTKQGSFVFWFGFFLLAIAVDQLLKWVVFNHRYNKVLIPHVLELTNFLNQNFALSVVLPTALMFGIYFVVLACVLIYIVRNFKNQTTLHRVSWILILAGGISNVLERAIFGSVRDFIFLYGGAVVNTADIYITAGIILLIALELIRPRLQ